MVNISFYVKSSSAQFKLPTRIEITSYFVTYFFHFVGNMTRIPKPIPFPLPEEFTTTTTVRAQTIMAVYAPNSTYVITSCRKSAASVSRLPK